MRYTFLSTVNSYFISKVVSKVFISIVAVSKKNLYPVLLLDVLVADVITVVTAHAVVSVKNTFSFLCHW
jgi:hypothetical protein